MSLSELLRIKREWMAALEAREADALTRMVDRYAEITNVLAAQAEGAWLAIERKRAAGEPVTQSQLFQEARIRALLQQAQQQFVEWSDAALAETEALRTSAVRIAGDAVRAELDYLTTPPGQSSSVIGAFDILPVNAINELLAALAPGSPVTKLFAHLPAGISAEIRKALTVGLAAGENPRAVGRRMTKAAGGGLANGVRIARTEMMRAYRAAHQANYQRNSDVVQGWIWLSARNSRTCAGCLAMHGTFHPLSESLDDHPNGRCTPLPVTKTWAELGYGDRGWKETAVDASQVESGEDWFARQSPATWAQVLGKAGAEAYAAGRVKLADFAGIQKSPVWGNSIYQRSLADALKAAEARRRAQPPAASMTRTNTLAPTLARIQPAGAPVSRALVLQSDSIKGIYSTVMKAIDGVHGDGALPPIPVLDVRLPKGIHGAYGRNTETYQPLRIRISTNGDHKRMTLAHETGHFIDHAGIGSSGLLFASTDSPVLNRWREAVNGSKTVKRLKKIRDEVRRTGRVMIDTPMGKVPARVSLKDLNYLLSAEEVFARSYAQYIATRSGDAEMLAELAKMRGNDKLDLVYLPRQWLDDDFEPIAKAFDQVFKELKWREDH